MSPTTTTVFRAQGKSAMSRLPTEKMRAFSGMKGTNVFSFVWVAERFCGLTALDRRPNDETGVFRILPLYQDDARWERDTSFTWGRGPSSASPRRPSLLLLSAAANHCGHAIVACITPILSNVFYLFVSPLPFLIVCCEFCCECRLWCRMPLACHVRTSPREMSGTDQ
jgi:hypothetical protein